MKRALAALLWGGCLTMLFGPPAAAAPVELHEFTVPEKGKTTVSMVAAPGAPGATVEAVVSFEDPLSLITVAYESMKPAFLYGGDVGCYVLWAVTPDGDVENLGELVIPKPDGKQKVASRMRRFALMVTAESYHLVDHPSELVVFIGRPETGGTRSQPFTFAAFDPAPAREVDDITTAVWHQETPVVLVQARRAFDLATRDQAEIHAQQIYEEAGEALDHANSLAEENPRSGEVLAQARESLELSNEAIALAQHRRATDELLAAIATRRAQVLKLENDAAAAQAEVAALEKRRSDLESSIASMNSKTAELERRTADMSALLGTALSNVAHARETARGFIVDLPDILFGVDEATLRPDAHIPLAKLAGILLIMEGLGISVEGYTDSSGSMAHNMKLSEQRAAAVRDFLAQQGVPAGRMKVIGLGPKDPVADNTTPEGRRKNRRVQIVIGEAEGLGS